MRRLHVTPWIYFEPKGLNVTSLVTGVAAQNFKKVLSLNSPVDAPGASPLGFTSLFAREMARRTAEALVDVETFWVVIKW